VGDWGRKIISLRSLWLHRKPVSNKQTKILGLSQRIISYDVKNIEKYTTLGT
jgi:transcriptional antiterminator